MKRERQERPEGDVAPQPETRLWEALSRAIQAGNASDQAEAVGDGDGERGRAAREALRASLGKDAPLGRVGH